MSSNQEPDNHSDVQIGVITDFNPHNLATRLAGRVRPLSAVCYSAPFGQAIQTLHSANSEMWERGLDAVVVWTAPEIAVPGFFDVLHWRPFTMESLLTQVDEFAALVERATSTIPTVIVPTWSLPAHASGLGPLEMRTSLGVTNTLMRLNLRLAERFEVNGRVMLLDSQPWLAAAGSKAFSPRLWYRSKTPYVNEVFEAAARDMTAVILANRGGARKIVILDLDNTLWGGVVGDLGWEGIRLGGHDPAGEAFCDFQQLLKRLTQRGVLLGIVSKNDEATALQAIRHHPEMRLHLDDFAGWRINWNDKAQNIVDLLAGLNLGLDAAVFIDDSPFERARVKEALPSVMVPELPEDPLDYPQWLQCLRCFHSPAFSQEDRQRTAMYVADRKRTAIRATATSLGAWLQDLDLKIAVRGLGDSNASRTLQLFQRTNQMNMSTRRLTRAELDEWLSDHRHRLWTFSVADRFGDYGLCGIASVDASGEQAVLRDFLVSCRVMGRGVEESMFAVVADYARSVGQTTFRTCFVRTAKNGPCERWLRERPSARVDDGQFIFDVDAVVSPPQHVQLIFDAESHPTFSGAPWRRIHFGTSRAAPLARRETRT
jgi:FkbH-like protein